MNEKEPEAVAQEALATGLAKEELSKKEIAIEKVKAEIDAKIGTGSSVRQENSSQDPHRIVVVAKNASEMQKSQDQMVAFATQKIAFLRTSIDEANKNLEFYKSKKWRTAPFKLQVDEIKKEVSKWEKIEAALKAGYVIIPNFPDSAFDVFAIRTTLKNPRKNTVVTKWSSRPNLQESNSPPLGQGTYVSPVAEVDSVRVVVKHEQGKSPEYETKLWASEFVEADFPFRLAKPQILEDTAKAMELGIFDDIAISPRYRSSRVRGDPMVMGRIFTKKGYQTRAVTFLITWFVDTADL